MDNMTLKIQYKVINNGENESIGATRRNTFDCGHLPELPFTYIMAIKVLIIIEIRLETSFNGRHR